MKIDKTQIVAAVFAVIALLAGIFFVAVNNTSQAGGSTTDSSSDVISGGAINPQQALVHTIAACDAYASGRYFAAQGNTDSAVEYMTTAADQADKAKSFDPYWDRFSGVMNELTDRRVVADATSYTVTNWYEKSAFTRADQLCESVISWETPEIAEKMACALQLDSETARARGLLSSGGTWLQDAITYSTYAYDPADPDRSEVITPLGAALRAMNDAYVAEDESAIAAAQASISELCEAAF